MTFYHRIEKSDLTASGEEIRCPSCNHATDIDPPEWDCEHCDEKLALFVGCNNVE